MNLDPNTVIAARLIAEIRPCLGDYEALTRRLDSMVALFLSLGNTELATLANWLGASEMNHLLTAHAAQGQAIAELSAMAEAVLANLEGREPGQLRQADIRPLSDKLSEQYRALTFDGETFAVIDLPRQDATDPESESAL